MGIVSRAVDTYYTYKFIRILTQRWVDMPAYKLGIIDRNGNVLRKKSTLTTSDEHDAYTYFHRVVWRLKRLLEKTPFIGKWRLTNYAAALWLIKEDLKGKSSINIEDVFKTHLKTSNILIEEAPMRFNRSLCINPGIYKISSTQYIRVDEALYPIGKCLGASIYQVGDVVFSDADLVICEDGPALTVATVMGADADKPVGKKQNVIMFSTRRKKIKMKKHKRLNNLRAKKMG